MEMRGERNKSQRVYGYYYTFFTGYFLRFLCCSFLVFFTCSSGSWHSENSKPHRGGLVADDGEWVLFIWTLEKSSGRVRVPVFPALKISELLYPDTLIEFSAWS
jgi:hypothetical protein